MIFNRKRLPDLTAPLVGAARRGDEPAFDQALDAVRKRAALADVAELSEAVGVLGPVLAEEPAEFGRLAVVVGGLLEAGAEPGPELETLARRVAEALEQRWASAEDWARGLLIPLQRKEVRRALPHRERLVRAASDASEVGPAEWLVGLLTVLDDERLIVLHRPSGLGYEVTIGGIGDNFQLHTLLAATLIGDPAQGLVPGTPPDPAWVAAASDGDDLEPAGGIRGQFNLVDAHGEWIWNEGRPADIPEFDGRRVVVLDPPAYPRTWNAGRAYPHMPPTITLDRVLPNAEAAAWLAKTTPDTRLS